MGAEDIVTDSEIEKLQGQIRELACRVDALQLACTFTVTAVATESKDMAKNLHDALTEAIATFTPVSDTAPEEHLIIAFLKDLRSMIPTRL